MFRLFRAFVSCSLCPDAKSQSKSSDIFHLDSREVVRIRGCVTFFIFVAVYWPGPVLLADNSILFTIDCLFLENVNKIIKGINNLRYLKQAY